MSKYKVSLVFRGEIINNLHYGPYASAWWISRPNDNDTTFLPLYPLCLGMKTITTINDRDFMITVIQNDLEPGFLCQSEDLQSNVCKSSLEAITSIYQLAFSTKTKFNGLLVMGFNNSEICNLLLSDIYFQPFSFKISNLNLVLFEIGILNNPNWNYASKGYKSSFIYNFQKIWSLFLQEFTNNEAVVKVYQNSQEKYVFRDANPNIVWNKIGILAQFIGNILFGLEHEHTKLAIEKEQTPHCTIEDWQTKFKEIYLPNYIIKDRELRAWKALLRNTSCSNITPFGKESKCPNHENQTDQFWSAFQDALDSNIHGNDEKRRILSIIADKFYYDTIKEKLSVSNYLITEARRYARINGPGDKANIIMSSYKTDSTTRLPVHYLKNTKNVL
ncbi:hypothetical protein C2G38_2221483 [Gigaspora rosea]|uniref:Uncharacterized protein n=1 Tax=Gigaspora rosea TaxID=44941 RepID=A0A397U3I7_9GLOM|nr:hypothetical protein C2G38_2221483 [Gigaspora rosea]